MGRITDNQRRTRVVGLCLLVGAIALLAYGPYHRAVSHANVPMPTTHAVFGTANHIGPVTDDPANALGIPLLFAFHAVRFLSTVTVIPAVLAAWGAGIFRTGEVRSLTPPRAAAAIPLALAPVLVLVHLEPVGAGACDTVPCTDPFRPAWTRPSGGFEVAEAMFHEGAVAYGAAGFFALGGVATDRSGPVADRWVPGLVLFVLGWFGVVAVADPSLLFTAVFWLGGGVLGGYPLWRFGRWAATPTRPDTGRDGDAPASPDVVSD